MQLRVLAGCEKSGKFRKAVQALGHICYSCDMLPAEDDAGQYHIIGDVVELLHSEPWDMALIHVPCTRLTRAGQRWLNVPPKGKTREQMWSDYNEAIALFRNVWNSPVRHLAIENPRMHVHAIEDLSDLKMQIQSIQPYWFGHPAFKETLMYRRNLPELKATDYLPPPKYGTVEHKKWQVILNERNNAARAENRARTFDGMADAWAAQYTEFVCAVKAGKYVPRTFRRKP